MNEITYSDVIQAMLDYFQVEGNDWLSGFRTGSFLTIFTFLLLLLLVIFILAAFRRRRNLKFIHTDAMQISAKAASELIAATAAEISGIQLQKTAIRKAWKKQIRLILNIDYCMGNPQATPLQEIVARLKDDTRAALSKTFGIENIREIVVRVVRTKTY